MILIISTVILLIAFIYFFFLKNKNNVESQQVDLDEVNAFLKINGGNHVSHLTFINDKRVFWTKDKDSLIIYQKVGNKLIVLGDPVGKENHVKKAILEFVEYANLNFLQPVFYQASKKFLSAYKEAGYELFKLGEEARINLHDFTLVGKKVGKLRTSKNKFEKSGYKFKIVEPPYTDEFINQIRTISDSWLGERKEKGFSVGYFCEQYISRFPLAILVNETDQPIAFATLACDDQKEDKTITIDLMRYMQDSPNGTMDMLFISIFSWCKEHGYDWCSMGMAPLSHMGSEQSSTKLEKIARFTFHYGNTFYNFKGLFEYKNKFSPLWEPRYLVYKRTFLPVLLLQLVYLIHFNKKNTNKIRPNYIKKMLKKVA
ncbi:phosphatidylglycerol lysyltransferase domain-containing protein [Cytobacillus sp. FJAT-54145]|uniref:Phosphatidylglycerol lysyltransferase domain-containing protein n=1 Tax=Cytobacillus spartinae TaxID=3299023 RepID=A0ABW6K545_9BACI